MKTFLQNLGWGKATQTPLAGDASSRSYIRLTKGDQSAILMQDPDGDVALFARLARHLSGLGLSAPQIYGQAPGLLLLEDLGDGLLARLAQDPQRETGLYLLATDALLELHQHPCPPDLPVATPQYLTQMIDLAFTHYTQAPDALEQAQDALLPLLERYALPCDVMVLRDYHAENALLLPDRNGVARLGLLDFQDALQGHRAYDLVSLIRDARRDVSPDLAETCIAHYLKHSNQNPDDFRAALAVLGVQRNLRILGVFARLAATRGKPGYIDLIPRVWAHLQTDLQHPILAQLKSILQSTLPEPSDTHLEYLRSTCPIQ